jgi:hypothetical protein
VYFDVLYSTRMWLSLFARSMIPTTVEEKIFRSAEFWLCVVCQAGTNVSQQPAVSTLRAESTLLRPSACCLSSVQKCTSTLKMKATIRRADMLFYPKEECSRFLRNVGTYLPDQTRSSFIFCHYCRDHYETHVWTVRCRWQTYFLFPLVNKFGYFSGQ